MTDAPSDDVGSYVLVAGAVFAVALVARLVPLYWSLLPATLDGFRYAALATATLGRGVPWAVIDADELVFTAGLATASAVTGLRPLLLAQPFAAAVGAAVPLVGVTLARRIAGEWGWSGRRVRVAAALAGLSLAVEGLLLRRTGVPDEEVVGLLLVPVLALAAHRWLARSRASWGVVTALVGGVLPPLHNLSALIGVLSVTGLAAGHAVRATGRRAWLRIVALAVGSWIAFVGYFDLAARLGLRLTFTGLLRPYPGLFLAWVVALAASVAWARGTSRRGVRLGFGLAVGGLVALAVGNAVRPLFPGTITTGAPLLVALGGLAVLVGFATVAVPRVRSGTALVCLAMLAAPVTFAYYGLSAALTPAFFGAVQRVQSFLHVPALALAAIGAVAVGTWIRAQDGVPRSGSGSGAVPGLGFSLGRALTVGAILVFAVGVALTVPVGYLALDTGTAPSTTYPSELAAAEFTAHVAGPFAADHRLSQLVVHHAGDVGRRDATGRVTVAPVRSWLSGGPPPGCPVLIQRSWTTTGAHLYPQPAATLPPERFDRWLGERSVVYAATGRDPTRLVLPQAGGASGC